MTIREIAKSIEEFAPLEWQESYDNAGLQVGDPDAQVIGVLLCLDVTESILDEALARNCNLIISHHPLIFHGLKSITGANETQRIVIRAINSGIGIYSAHTNLDSAWNGVSHEMAHMLQLRDIEVLSPHAEHPEVGIGVIGTIEATPKMEFLRKVKEKFNVRALRYSALSDKIVIKKVAIVGGSGATFIKDAMHRGADAIVTGDVKYHDFTTYGRDIVIADTGHYESELCTARIFSRIIRSKYPELAVFFSEAQTNPVGTM